MSINIDVFTFILVYSNCDVNRCENGGTCVKQGVSYSCNCLSDYTGSLCETRLSMYSSIKTHSSESQGQEGTKRTHEQQNEAATVIHLHDGMVSQF